MILLHRSLKPQYLSSFRSLCGATHAFERHDLSVLTVGLMFGCMCSLEKRLTELWHREDAEVWVRFPLRGRTADGTLNRPRSRYAGSSPAHNSNNSFLVCIQFQLVLSFQVIELS